MIDLQIVNQAIYDALQECAPPDTRYILVLLDADMRACISSNTTDEKQVHRMLVSAANVVKTAKPHDFIMFDKTVGHA